jgi:dTDP-4-dehydrorhamnose 3,5-epimerase
MKALVIPEGCAHGFQSLENNIEMIYLHTKAYCKKAEGTLRYDDPKVAIQWPLQVLHVSDKDASFPFISNNYQINIVL